MKRTSTRRKKTTPKGNKGEIIIATPKAKVPFTPRIGIFWRNRKARRFIWYSLFFLAILSIFATHYLPLQYPVKEGDVSPNTIRASQNITFEDARKTAENRRLATEKIEEVYVIDKKILGQLEEEIGSYFNGIYRIVSRDSIDSREKIRLLRREYNLGELAASIFLSAENDTVRALQTEALNLLRTNWQNGVKENEVQERKEKIQAQIELLNYNQPYREVIKSAFNSIELKPNYFPDQAATIKAKEEAAKNVGIELITIKKGQKIVGEGEAVTAQQIEILRLMGLQRTSSPYITLAGVAILFIFSTILTVLFIKYYRRELFKKSSNMLLLCLLVFITLLFSKLIISVKISPLPEVAELVNYLVPMAMGSMLITILLDTKLAVYLTLVLSIFIGILTGNQLTYTINAFMGGMVGIYGVSKFSQRLDWAKAGLFVACANVICVFALSLMNNASWQVTLIGLLLGIMNGFLSAILAYGSLPFLESGFKVTTSVRLLELSNPGQPLLKRLLIEAPGTYHHSILVGNLGEAAADAVGADSLLVRVGSYYHDIGKLKRPYFFIENQLGGENPHEKLTPALSTLIITSHIKDGLELASQYALPPVIQDLIAQHHGTSVATYFYHKALEMGNADNIKEEDYRYDAAKPQSKEAAIIMLADNVEAAVRSMTNTNPAKIESLVKKIFKERLHDGQLDESELTFKDLDLIANAFTHILGGIFHSRIEYPENVLKAMEGGKTSDGNPGGQPSE